MAEMVQDRRRQAADLDRQSLELHGELAEWNRLLQEIDPHLQLIKAPENAHHPSLKPGYYHIIRTPPASVGPPTIMVHEGPEGEFRDPDSQMLEDLRRGDMWNDRAMREKTERDRKLQKAAESRRALEREERVEEMLDRAKFHFIPKISVPKEVPK